MTTAATPAQLTAAELYALLSHADAQVRSLADWAREFRGFGTRGLLPSEYAAAMYEQQLRERLARIEAAELPVWASSICSVCHQPQSSESCEKREHWTIR